MVPSVRPQAQVHRGSQTKQHTSFFVRTLTWLIDEFLRASVGFMAQTLERAKMHLRRAKSRARGLYAALVCASPRGSIAGARSGHGEFVWWPLRDPAARLCQCCTVMQPPQQAATASDDQLTVVPALGRQAEHIPNAHSRDDDRNRMPVKSVLDAVRHFVHRLSGVPAALV